MVVNTFILGLLVDLDHRCERFQKTLQEHQAHADVISFRERISDNLHDIRERVAAAKLSDGLQHQELWTEALLDYQDLTREVALIEQFALPVILRYDERDREFADIVDRLITETNTPRDLLPTVTVMSEQYYWTQPEFKVIAIPVGDIRGLLGWPDFLHELGHIFLLYWRNFLGSFSTFVKQYFKSRRDQLADIGASPYDSRMLFVAENYWRDQWQIELAADLIATFLCGPSFVWQHMRLMVNHGSDPFFPTIGQTADHPADQCRFDCMLEMLDKLGDSSIEALKSRWSEILALSLNDERPQGHETYYPAEVVKAIAAKVFESCQEKGLVAYNCHGNAFTVVGLVNQAWQQFTQDPEAFSTWEKQAYKDLRAMLSI